MQKLDTFLRPRPLSPSPSPSSHNFYHVPGWAKLSKTCHHISLNESDPIRHNRAVWNTLIFLSKRQPRPDCLGQPMSVIQNMSLFLALLHL